MNANKNRQRGKRAERKVAKILKAKRVGILGKSDVEHPLFSFEVKSRQKFIAEKWFAQAVKNCEKDKIPAVIVHIVGRHYDNDYVIIRLKDLINILDRRQYEPENF